MSIDDDGWDVEAALKGKPEAEAFDNFMAWAYKTSGLLEVALKENQHLRKAIEIVESPPLEKPNEGVSRMDKAKAEQRKACAEVAYYELHVLNMSCFNVSNVVNAILNATGEERSDE